MAMNADKVCVLDGLLRQALDRRNAERLAEHVRGTHDPNGFSRSLEGRCPECDRPMVFISPSFRYCNRCRRSYAPGYEMPEAARPRFDPRPNGNCGVTWSYQGTQSARVSSITRRERARRLLSRISRLMRMRIDLFV